MSARTQINEAWLQEALDDVDQWRDVMPNDANHKRISWDQIAALDVNHGLGQFPMEQPIEVDADAAAQALGADYAMRERIEALLKQSTSAFMCDFERAISSFRLPRALAYLNRRLNDEIGILHAQVQAAHEQNNSSEAAAAANAAVLPVAAADNSDATKTHAAQQGSAQADNAQQGSTSAGATSQQNTTTAHSSAKRSSDSDWRNAYLPGRDVDTVMGIDIETTGINAWRDYIIDVGFEMINLQSDSPAEHEQYNIYTESSYSPRHAYDQARLPFGVPPLAAQLGNPFILDLTGIDVTKRADAQYRPFDEWDSAQKSLLERLERQPYVAHNATFEHKFFMFNIAGYAEAYRNGHITIIDTLPMSRQWDEGSQPSEEHPMGDNRLEAYAQRMGALPEDLGERHLGLEDAHIMLEAMRTHLHQLKEHNAGPFGPRGRRGVGGKHCRRR
ncbi:DNA polymerase III subunit epsilon [Bifidobacterium dolichotidis]|uniref:DNA polymerase III subunit epsilon n=1 Tax=Bifidobacterium dolichotidis TaxID=2306976 RepID=A0A430FRW0_9BIFI|nr:DNA polymerase III [Bifidobacterium dolichotidis]RSX55585.1 DNA polymerase III subunit epsilon [Bifidobacterium dolichotidis]